MKLLSFLITVFLFVFVVALIQRPDARPLSHEVVEDGRTARLALTINATATAAAMPMVAQATAEARVRLDAQIAADAVTAQEAARSQRVLYIVIGMVLLAGVGCGTLVALHRGQNVAQPDVCARLQLEARRRGYDVVIDDDGTMTLYNGAGEAIGQARLPVQ